MKKLIVVLFTVLCLTGCTLTTTSTTNTEKDDAVEETMKKVYVSLTTDIYEFIDPDTGVHYLIYKSLEKGGITPRYNADGTLMVTKVK